MFKLSKKINEKWQTIATIKKNQYGNLSFGMKVTPEVKAMINGVADGGWFNLSVFEAKDDNGQQ